MKNPNFNVKFSKKIKACPDIHIPVSVVGGIDSADMADQILDEGGSDMVAIARALLTDGNLLNKAYRGEDSYVPRPCIRCWDCCGAGYQHIHCAVNPQLCRDARYSSVKKAETKKSAPKAEKPKAEPKNKEMSNLEKLKKMLDAEGVNYGEACVSFKIDNIDELSEEKAAVTIRNWSKFLDAIAKRRMESLAKLRGAIKFFAGEKANIKIAFQEEEEKQFLILLGK